MNTSLSLLNPCGRPLHLAATAAMLCALASFGCSGGSTSAHGDGSAGTNHAAGGTVAAGAGGIGSAAGGVGNVAGASNLAGADASGGTLNSNGGSAGTSTGGGASSGSGGMGASGGSAAAGAGGSAGNSCPGAAYDSASPPKTLMLTGNLGAHDPAAYVVGKTVYLAATGIVTKSSTNLTAWTSWPAGGGTHGGAWAPDISNFGGLFHLYYAVSTFGSNQSCIGQETRAALDSGSWADKGNVLCSNMGTTKDDWNAIDPNIIVDDSGVPWLDFGSFWSGIKLVKLNTDGTRADMELLDLASGPKGGAVEGPFIFKRCGFYYLFVSFGSCCSAPYNYTIRVGRSATVTGPYMDKDGVAMMNGGGTLLVQGDSNWSAPGHNAVITYDNRTYNVYHALAAPSGQNGTATLRIAEIAWDANGWPISGGP
jgi:arabinan endo-1,5-alpha-L-arabinosidase